eukprot:Gb_20805 [translate_table: standard]
MSLSSNNLQIRKRRTSRGPAFVPSVDISAVSLVHALVALAQQVICWEKPKGCQRNAGFITRKIKVLTILFEEVRDVGVPLPPSALLCFRELYVMLQRTKFLLEDCSGDGSCVWLLMQTEAISNQFHVLTQDMATALDVLPLRLLDVSDEVREQIELVHKQARKAKLFVDVAEEQLCRDVLAVLDEFEKEVIPNESKLRRIFNNLQLEDARGCQREIELLEEEMRNQNNLGAERNVSIINSLIGFMRYCKCVLFGVAGMESETEFQPSSESPVSSVDSGDGPAIPDDFRCPISLELMTEPVIVSTGQTYDRASITRWVEDGHSTCPKSGQKLLHTNLTPNYALRSLIVKYCDEHNMQFEKPEKSKNKSSLESITSTKAALEATKMTAAFLVENLARGSFEVKKQVAYELRLLAKCGMENRACIAEAGAIPLLVPLLSSHDPKAQENAVTALLNLSIYESNKAKIMQSAALQPIINVLRTGRSMEARENAAATLFSLSAVNEYKKLIGEVPEAIPALVDLLRVGTSRGKRDAATALFNLSVYRQNDLQVIAAGAVPLLVNLLTDETPGLTDDALAVLAILAGQVEGLIVISETSAIPLLVGLLRSGSPKGKENSIVVLLTLCCNGGDDIVNTMLRLPSLIPSLYTLITSGTPRAKRKASSLLKILQSWEPSRTLHTILSSRITNPVTSLH